MKVWRNNINDFDYYSILKEEIPFSLKDHLKNPFFKDFHLISESLSNNSEFHKEVNYSLRNKLYPKENYILFFNSTIEKSNYVVRLNDLEVYSHSMIDTIDSANLVHN